MQAQTENYLSEANVLLRNESTFGIVIHTEGMGFNYRRGKHITGERKRLFELEGVSMHHPKEIKITRSDNSKGYYFGKLNSLFLLRSGLGLHRVLFRKAKQNGIEIRYALISGFSFCLAKPVYLDIYGTDQKTVSTERYDPSLHNQTNIYGRSSFFTGVDETKLYPGGYTRFSLCFEMGKQNSIRLLEVGAIGDLYPYRIPVMSNIKNQPFFATLYLSVLFGKKWI